VRVKDRQTDKRKKTVREGREEWIKMHKVVKREREIGGKEDIETERDS